MGKDILKYYLEQDISSEAINDSIEEIEMEFYCKIDDFDQLKNAKYKEEQEQWSIFFNKKEMRNTIRARKCIKDNEISFELANKIRIDGLDSEWELENSIDRHHFDLIKDIARQGMKKTRYFFPIDGTDMIWEVDVFYDKDDNPLPWVKIDLEMHEKISKIPPYPIVGTNWIEEQFGERSPETIDAIDKLYRNYFIIRKPKEKE